MQTREIKLSKQTTKTQGGKREQVITRIIERFNSLSKKDIKDWRKSREAALNINRPNRVPFLNLCDEVMLDPHLTAVIEHGRRDKLFSEVFRIVDQTTGEEDKELTEFFRGAWFFEFCELVLSSRYYGHSLIQIGDIIEINGRKTIADVQLIPRRHVRPEYGEILKDQNDERGYPYRNDASMMYWLVEVGKPRDLGLLEKAAPICLFKKNCLSAWSEYGEVFGMPMRVGKTNSREKVDLDRMEENMQKSAKSAYVIFNEGEDVKFIESTKGDAFNVYDKLIERCNGEISKLIVGATLTTDTGPNGNRSLGQVHEQASDNITESDKRLIASTSRDQLMALLEMRGLKVAGKKFEYSEQKDLAALYTRTIGFLEYYDIDPQEIEDNFGIRVTLKAPVTPPADPNAPAPDGGAPAPVPPVKKKKAEKKKLSWVDSLYKDCQCCEQPALKLSVAKENVLNTAAEALLKRIFEGDKLQYNQEVFAFTSAILIDGLIAGWQNKKKLQLAYRSTVDLAIDYTSPDWQTVTQMESNLFQFSAAKTLAMVNELNAKLPESKTFEDFKKNTKGIVDSFTSAHMRTEYNFAWQTAQNAAEYHRMVSEKDVYPYWQYITAGDSRVRPAHKALDRLTFRADDPAFGTIYPPNGWNCRCYVKPIRSYPESKLSNEAAALDALAATEIDTEGGSELDRMRKNGMDINRAKEGVVFTANQMYAKDALDAKLGVKDNGVTPYEKIVQNKLPKIAERIQERDKAFATQWHKDNAPDSIITDYAQRPIVFTAETIDKHSKPKYESEGRLNLLEFIPEVLNNPSEVYLQKLADNKFQYMYMKFYDGKALVVPAELSAGTLTIKTWFELDKQIDDRRSGILIKQ